MRKAVLVIDMPDTCGRCQLCQGVAMDGEYVCSILDEDGNERGYDDGKYDKPDWCPLKEVPSAVDVFVDDWADGYNACLEDIFGGK